VHLRAQTPPQPGLAFEQQPTILIDGVKATQAAMKALDRSRIANIDIIKGAAAIREYGDDAKNGMIIIKMKPVGAP
jgi:outer membrane cobalamin receptor